MKRNSPAKPRTAPETPANEPQAPTPTLEEALAANANLARLLGEVANRLDGLRMAILKAVG